MAKKNKIEVAPGAIEPISDETGIEQPVAEQVTAPAKEPQAKPEALLTVTVTETFKDGALKDRFAKYGYGVVWKAGETRSIPMNLFVRCIRSGAKFET